MLRNLHTEIEIDAPLLKVWSILTDFGHYREWNPFIRALEGDLRVGTKLTVTLQQEPGGRPVKIRPEVVLHRPERSFAWKGRLLHRALFVGEHRFEVEEVGEQKTRFVQSEEFDGVLLPLVRRMLDTKTRAAFESMNRALKAEAER